MRIFLDLNFYNLHFYYFFRNLTSVLDERRERDKRAIGEQVEGPQAHTGDEFGHIQFLLNILKHLK